MSSKVLLFVAVESRSFRVLFFPLVFSIGSIVQIPRIFRIFYYIHYVLHASLVRRCIFSVSSVALIRIYAHVSHASHIHECHPHSVSDKMVRRKNTGKKLSRQSENKTTKAKRKKNNLTSNDERNHELTELSLWNIRRSEMERTTHRIRFGVLWDSTERDGEEER